MTRPLGVLAVLIIVASGCATGGSVRRIQVDLGMLRVELASVRAAYDEHARETTRPLEQLRALEARLREVGTAVGDTGDAVRRLGDRIVAVEAGLKELRGQVAPRPAAPPPPPEPPRESPPRVDSTIETTYQAALATFRTREYGQAVLDLLDFLAKYPKHVLAGSAQYWIGEAYYIERDWRQALVEFEKVLAHDPRNGKVSADALLRMGLCYQNLREPSRAQQAWQRVIAEHPQSDAAQRVRGLLPGASGPSRR